MTEASPTSVPADAVLVELDGVSKIYADGEVTALNDVSLSISAGEFVSIMGPSGCGKSTLLNMLGALDRPSSGEIRFGGVPLTSLPSLDQLRAQRIGFVFQSFYLLPNLNSLENVQIPMFEGERPFAEREGRATRLLELVGLADRTKHLPMQLSIGQRQRVAIARALANEPDVILADEPTGSLDSQSGREVMELLADLNRREKTTLVVVTHDAGVAAYGRRLVTMLDGRVTDDTRTASEPGEV